MLSNLCVGTSDGRGPAAPINVTAGMTFNSEGKISKLTLPLTGLVIGDSGADLIGFYGHAAAAQPTIPLTSPTAAQIAAALASIGLVLQADE